MFLCLPGGFVDIVAAREGYILRGAACSLSGLRLRDREEKRETG